MPITQESIKGWPIPEQPASIARCGMTRAKFAKRLVSGEWYELSGQGRNIGKGLVAISDTEEKELASL